MANKGTLVIVESPAKAKSIAKMLGAGYEVKASKGHVADLPERDLGVDVERDFAPEYEVKKDKKPVVDELKRAAKGKDVLIATDPDREGEAIGWHVARLLELDPSRPMRVEFHEITPRVVREAIRKPRPIDQSLVDAQQARRVLDRLVGYNLSPLLAQEFRRRALSAGRVQSVALRLLVEREAEIEAFVPQEYWTVAGLFESAQARFKAMLYSVEGERVQTAEKFLLTGEVQTREVVERIRQVPQWRISKIDRRERRRSPAAPFTTSTLQQAASGRLGWTAGRTMRVAQRLYEGIDLPEGTVGLITYMRTDSVRVSQEALAEVRKVIPQMFGQPYLPDKPNFYSAKKTASTQDAHEAIRPTSPSRTPDSVRSYLSEEEYRLYDLIWRRFVASQMTPAVFDQTTVTVEGGDFVFRATGSILKFDGYLKVWGRESEEEADNLLPRLDEGSPARLLALEPEQHFTEPPPRYTDASLVKTLEDLGIGRPSTYAPTIDTLEKRLYLERNGKTLKPTPLGKDVVRWLVEKFPRVVAYDFTATMEDHLDQIEEGKVPWPKVVREFYEPFMEEVSRLPRRTCPVCGRPMEVKVSRFGQFLGCTGYPECRHTERLEAKRAAEPIGEPCPKCHQGELVRRHGRYGSFISCSRYPECDYSRDEAPSTGIECPKCHAGEIVQKISKRGKPYYRCNNCDFLSFDRVLESRCSICGWNEIQKGRDKTACSNPDCERYGGPDLKALSERRGNGKATPPRFAAKEASRSARRNHATNAKRNTLSAKGSNADGKKKKATQTSNKPAAWKDLEPFLARLNLPAQEAEIVRRTQGQQKAVPEAAKALNLPENEALTLFRKGMFKLRMAYGRSKKEAVTA
ncbi:type I DNA topoisomerase [Allomeiothermus silvanus]|uniref:type I DNA topoisomerase n=1 Tax=Allomeiothermus silvanus TaxID=52022 RepID=UPI0023EFC25A|nr:type I DNA topoisomerase [Allomeiothermus silvanus]